MVGIIFKGKVRISELKFLRQECIPNANVPQKLHYSISWLFFSSAAEALKLFLMLVDAINPVSSSIFPREGDEMTVALYPDF